MFDRELRAGLQPLLNAGARPLRRLGITPAAVTGAGLAVGVAACVAAGAAAWNAALGLWLLNRLIDGLDGPVARLAGRGEQDREIPAGLLGGYLDVLADFTIYGGFVAGCAIGQPGARVACLVLLVTYYVNGAAFLGYASIAERLRAQHPDERSLHFVGGLTEGAETILAHVLMVLMPSAMATVAWAFAGMVAVTAVQRLLHARRTLAAAGS